MKNLKKVIALIAAMVMALSVNTFALNIEFSETIDSVPAWWTATNDDYMCIMFGEERIDGYWNCVVHVYKNVGDGWEEWATVTPHIREIGGTVPFNIQQIVITDDNTLLMRCYTHAQQGTSLVSAVNLDNLQKGTQNKGSDAHLTTAHFWGPNITEIIVIGDCWFVTASDGRCLRFVNGVATDWCDAYPADGWSTDKSEGYVYKTNEAGNIELYNPNSLTWVAPKKAGYTELLYTLQTSEIPGAAAVGVAGNYAAVVSNDGYVYSYDLTSEPVDGVIAATLIDGGIWGEYSDMDVYGKYAAVYSKSAKVVTVFDLEKCVMSNYLDAPSATGSASAIEFNDFGITVAHGDGKMDVFKIKTGVDMNVDILNAKYADLVEGEYVEDEYATEFVKIEVKVTNATISDINDGNVIFAAYEGDKLMGVSVKALPIVAGETESVWTEYVPVATTLKAFYWTSGNAPIVTTPFVDTWVE